MYFYDLWVSLCCFHSSSQFCTWWSKVNMSTLGEISLFLSSPHYWRHCEVEGQNFTPLCPNKWLLKELLSFLCWGLSEKMFLFSVKIVVLSKRHCCLSLSAWWNIWPHCRQHITAFNNHIQLLSSHFMLCDCVAVSQFKKRAQHSTFTFHTISHNSQWVQA